MQAVPSTPRARSQNTSGTSSTRRWGIRAGWAAPTYLYAIGYGLPFPEGQPWVPSPPYFLLTRGGAVVTGLLKNLQKLSGNERIPCKDGAVCHTGTCPRSHRLEGMESCVILHTRRRNQVLMHGVCTMGLVICPFNRTPPPSTTLSTVLFGAGQHGI